MARWLIKQRTTPGDLDRAEAVSRLFREGRTSIALAVEDLEKGSGGGAYAAGNSHQT